MRDRPGRARPRAARLRRRSRSAGSVRPRAASSGTNRPTTPCAAQTIRPSRLPRRPARAGAGAGLAANGEPDFVAQVVEIVVEDGHFTFAAAIDGDRKLLHDPTWPLRH